MDLSHRSLLLSLSTRAYDFFVPKWLLEVNLQFPGCRLAEEGLG